MIKIKTDQLLTLGMALTTDKRAMERRVRGVFARKRSAKGALALSAVLALALGFAAFTTACQPGQATASSSNVASGGNALVSGGDAKASDGDAKAEYTKEKALEWLSFSLGEARKFTVPRMEDVVFTERGTWVVQKNPDQSLERIATDRFLESANAIFGKSYVADDIGATYYIDQSGFRADVWRFDSKDGVLSGALNAKTLAFLSADCQNVPGDALHSSFAGNAQNVVNLDDWGTLDSSFALNRIAGILGGTVQDVKDVGGSGREKATAGWMIQTELQFRLGDGRYCSVRMYADEALTPTTVCVYPDADCAEEGVFWRADIEQNPNVVQLLSPEDFREGKPAQGDMTRDKAIAFFNQVIETAGSTQFASGERPPEPTTAFFVDYSGTRENYWRMEGSGIVLELTSKTGRLIALSSNGSLGTKLGLSELPKEQRNDNAFIDATKTLYCELFGNDAVESVSVCHIDGYSDYTMDLFMTDGTLHEVAYRKGMIASDSVYYMLDPGKWSSVPSWLEKWTTVNQITGKVSIVGFDNTAWMVTPKWIANGVYIHNETGEIFAREM